MSFQLIFTSAPRGLTLGRSGFCTVARHREISESLASVLERYSAYERPEEPGAGLPVIHSHRIIRLGSSTFHVLTRIQDAGVDYTQRGNHFAQHLIFLPGELSETPSPADVFLNWPGWLDNWTGPPRYLGPAEQPSLASIATSITLPAQTWQERTGDAGNAALLAQPRLRQGAILTSSTLPSGQALHLLGESLLLVEPDESGTPGSWSVPFTTHLQAHELEEDFCWRYEETATPDLLSSRRGFPVLSFDSPSWPPLTHPALVKRAREGGSSLPSLKDTARLPDLSATTAPPETLPKTSRRPSSPPRPAFPKTPPAHNPWLLVVSAGLLLMLVLGGAWFLTRASSSGSLSIAEQLVPLQNPGQREALRQFLRENPPATGDSETDSALRKASVWLEASDLLDQLQFLRRQEQADPLQEALRRAQNLPQISELRTALPRLAYEMEESQNWIAQKTTPVPPVVPAPVSANPAPNASLSLARFFSSRPVCLAALSPDQNLLLSRFPEAFAWMDNPEKNSARHLRIFPLNQLPLTGEGVTSRSQPRRNRSDPLRFYQGVHLLFEMKEPDETEEGRLLEFTFAKDFDTISPPGTFGRVLQFEDATGPLFSIFILRQGESESLLRLPRSMIDFDSSIPGYRLRRELFDDTRIALSGQATASLGLPAPADPSPSAGILPSGTDSWQKLPSPSAANLPALVLRLHFPGAGETKDSVPLILFEGGAVP